MLMTLVVVVGLLLTGDFSWLSADTSHVKAETLRPVITPEEPFTLTLALIGVGTIVTYLTVSRVLLRRRKSAPIQKPISVDEGLPVEQPSRGAA